MSLFYSTILFLLFLINLTNCIPGGHDHAIQPNHGSEDPSSSTNDQERVFKDYKRVRKGKRVIGVTRSPIYSTPYERGFPDIHISPGSEHHHVASFYLDKSIKDPGKSSDPSITFKNNFKPIDHEYSDPIFYDTIHHLREKGHRYLGEMALRSGKNINAYHHQPELLISSSSEKADGQLVSLLMRDKSPSSKQISHQASSSLSNGSSGSKRLNSPTHP